MEGRILEQGRPAELLALNGAYKRTGKPREVDKNLWGCPRCLDSLRKNKGKLEMFQDVCVFFNVTIITTYKYCYYLDLFICYIFSSEWWFPEHRRSHQGWWKISDFLPNTRRAFEKRLGSSWGAWFWHLGTWGDIPKKGLLKLPLLLFKHNINNIYILFSMFFSDIFWIYVWF